MTGAAHFDSQVDPRAQQLFKLLVEQYIADGTPVASKYLATHADVQVSSATIRNIMGQLESIGLVKSPHTSAGKVPTDQGYRFFVDSLLSVEPWEETRVKELEAELNPDLAPSLLVASATDLLSKITQMTCLITTPIREQVNLRHVEFVRLDAERVLVILVLNDREVQNRVIHTEQDYTSVELNQAANFINHEFGGCSLIDIRRSILDSMQKDKDQMDHLMQAAFDVASMAFAETDEEGQELLVSGESRLLDFSADTDTVKTLFDAVSRKGRVLHLLDRCLESSGVQLFIGDESGYQPLGDMSLVTSSYEVNGQVAGVLGVIGPTRMDYKDVIPVVDVTARLLSAAMRHG
ncbi:MAG: heat-inducible transcription repressor HrcA [Gammaproteobacteria bacterium]|nr:heat-inducible transcription repressor HrcA [Gammaproteobacteria bacterium]